MKIVIIEDERITANDLKKTLLSIEPDIEVVAVLSSVEDGITYFRNNDAPDLIFSDIQLGDGLSFEIFRSLNNQVPVIFCTAYNTYFSEAFETTGIDYVLKPFSYASIEKALLKYQNLERQFTRTREDYRPILELLEQKLSSKRNAVIVRHREKIIPLELSDIALFCHEHGCTFAITFTQERHLVNETMEELEKSFAPLFFRANRQFLVNRKAVKDASQFFNRKMIVNLNIPFKEQVLVGKLKNTSFIEWLSKS